MSRLEEIGGARQVVEQWNEDRTKKLRLMLYRLPEDDPREEETDA